ncbi:stealth family protein [Butyrivibrio sp. LC3010]|uniref:stealth family protein n=1 Tax=Butyrivibrio sp. LC3010 TaxID=1280680 RepID=UPI0003F816F9|nr:stealth family protein [Butyrivibrio sp. LC3010]
MSEKIDFVITWVDGNDEKWREERKKYSKNVEIDDRECRYRDWGYLQYWFRGVEKFAPWVNNVYFLTYGHVPSWLNVNHPKLKVVNHKEFIPTKYLPTFNSNAIELNIHNINNLEEQFVYFNDDMFLCDETKPQDFFVDGKPRDAGILTIHCYNLEVFIMSHIRNIGYVNKYFDIKHTICERPSNWFNLKYGKDNLRNFLLAAICPRFPGLYITHLPSNFLKSTLVDLWQKEYEALDETCMHRFRCIQDINQWIFKDFQIANNNFVPQRTSIGHSYSALQVNEVAEYVRCQKGKLISINDNDMSAEQFEYARREIICAFDALLPQKSAFEL